MLAPLTIEVWAAAELLVNSFWQALWSGGLFMLIAMAMFFLIVRCFHPVFMYIGATFPNFAEVAVGGLYPIGLVSLFIFGAVFYELTPWGFYLGETFVDGVYSFEDAIEQLLNAVEE